MKLTIFRYLQQELSELMSLDLLNIFRDFGLNRGGRRTSWACGGGEDKDKDWNLII